MTFYLKEEIVNNLNLDKNKIIGALIIYKDGEINKTEVYNIINNQYSKNESLSGETYVVSSNDLTDIGYILTNGNSSYSCLALIDFSSIGKNPKLIKSTFQNNVDKCVARIANSLSNIPPGNWGSENPHQCSAPCQETDAAYCVGSESQSGGENWYCVPDLTDEGGRCHKEDQDNAYTHTIFSSGEIETQNDGLRSFRDNYLHNSAKGQEYIQKYYYLSMKLRDSIDVTYASQCISVLVNDILPIIDTLQNGTDTSAILFSNTKATNIINVLSMMKAKLPLTGDKAMIDSLISDVNFYKNKSLNFVDENFNDL